MNDQQTPKGHDPHTSNVRRFRCITKTDKPKPPCSHCTIDHVPCPDCMARDLVPNATSIQYVEDMRVHVGHCIRHGKLVMMCPRSDSAWGEASVIRIHDQTYIAQSRMLKLMAVMGGAAFLGGMIIALVAIPLIARSFA